MKQFFKTKKGITIIALVITIILLIILAGITVNAALGDNGLIDIIKRATKGYNDEVDSQEDKINDLYGELQISANGRVTMNTEELTTFVNRLIDAKIQENASKYVPAGTVISYMASTPPEGYLTCEGQAVSRTDYADLFSAIGTTYGSGDGSTTFNVPDLRGEFLRGTGSNQHYTNANDGNIKEGSGASVGQHQKSTVIPYFSTRITSGGAGGIWWDKKQESSNNDDSPYNVDSYHSDKRNDGDTIREAYYTFNASNANSWMPVGSTATTSFTTRPTNTSVLYCIKH